jgi:hypothetical protein
MNQLILVIRCKETLLKMILIAWSLLQVVFPEFMAIKSNQIKTDRIDAGKLAYIRKIIFHNDIFVVQKNYNRTHCR